MPFEDEALGEVIDEFQGKSLKSNKEWDLDEEVSACKFSPVALRRFNAQIKNEFYAHNGHFVGIS